jgi:threonine/homoserine/homoserine lactone efflux protein
MNHLVKIFLTGLLISFLGSVPLGTLNVAAIHIAVQDGLYAALLFSAAAVLIEIVYVRIALVAVDWITRQRILFKLFEWLTVFLLLALATESFIAAIRMSGIGNALPIHSAHPFLLGVLLSATNPMPISFWFGWSSVLLSKHILLPQNNNYNIYVAGIGIGSIMGFGVFIFGGNYLVNGLKANQNILNWAIGAVLLITAFIQLYKIICKPSASLVRDMQGSQHRQPGKKKPYF